MHMTRRRKLIMLFTLGSILAGMGGLVAVAQPLYALFCQVTGYGGTTQVAAIAPDAESGRIVTVQFNADIASGMPWKFKPSQREVVLRVGEQRLAFYTATNTSDEPVLGSATFNVTPLKAGLYFSKVDCFCFEEQLLMPGETVEMPVTFFVDPDIEDDTNLDEVKTITLSYTFFNRGDEERDEYLRDNNQQLASRDSGAPVTN